MYIGINYTNVLLGHLSGLPRAIVSLDLASGPGLSSHKSIEHLESEQAVPELAKLSQTWIQAVRPSRWSSRAAHAQCKEE